MESEPISGSTRVLAGVFKSIFGIEPNKKFMDYMAPVSQGSKEIGYEREMRFGWDLVRSVFNVLPQYIQRHFKGEVSIPKECWGAVSNIVQHYFELARNDRLPATS